MATDANAEAASRISRFDDRLHVLSGALRAFAEATTDYEHLLDVVARAMSVVADGCIVRLLSDEGSLSAVAFHLPLEAYVRDADAAARVRAFMAAPQRVADYAWGEHLIETGEAFLAPRMDMTGLTAEIAEVYETIGIHSLLVTVLRVRGKSIGTLSLFRFDPTSPSFDERDQEMAQALADHAALAIANARSYAAERVARDAAEKATARFARLSEAGVIGTVVIDLDGRGVVDVNDTLLHLLGYSRDELLSGRVPWSSLTPPEWSDVDARAVEQLTTSGVAGLREKEFLRKDGTRVPVLAGSAMLGGGTTECISFVLDLTERKEAERGRREAERRSQRMVESATVGMWTVGADGRTTFMNACMADILGRDVAEAVTMPTTEFFFAEDRPAMAERLAKRRDGLAGPYEQRFRRPDGAVGVLSMDSSPLYDAQGRYEGVLGIATDITERKQAQATIEQLRHERALGEQKAQLAAIVDASDDAIIGKTLDGVITSWNPGAHRIFGYSADEAVGKSICLLIPPGRESEEPAILEHLARGEVERFDTVRRRKDGREVDVSVTSSPVRDATGRVVGISKVARDITDRIRAEAALARAKDAAESASRELEAFSYSVAHDLRAPLRGMNGFARVLLDKYREKFDAEGQDWLQEILLNAKKMGSLIDGLLSLAQWTRSELRRERVDLSAIVRDVVESLRASEPRRTVELQLEDKLCADVDSRLARSLLENLLGNAWKFTSKAPNARIEFGATEKDGFAAFFVRDNGAGFDMAFASKLFAPFQRLHTSDEFPGTGIGLATVQRIVQRHGGRIWAEGVVNGGATFWFAFPARPSGSIPCIK